MSGLPGKIRYYLASIPTLLGQLQNWYVCFPLWLRRRPAILRLRNGCRFKVRSLMDVWIIKETCLDHDYETHAVPIQPGWTVLDIGAGLGDFAISIAYAHPECRVYAYEPFPESYRLLEENIVLNGLRNVTTAPVAVGARSGELTLFATGAAVQHTTSSASAEAAHFTVPGLSLEDVFETHGLTICDFLKMDCEGGEFDILFHAPESTLARIAHLCLEYHDGVTEFTHTDLATYLQQRGFQVHITPNPVHSHLGFLYAHREPGP